MQASTVSNRIHPLMAGAAGSVILVSLVGVAAITGILPSSHSSAQPTAVAAMATPAVATLAPASAPAAQVAAVPAATPTPVKEVVQHKTIVHHKYVEHRVAPKKVPHAPSQQYAEAAPQRPVYQQPVYNAPVVQAPAPVQHSMVGIATGAVVGGLIGNQIGGGNGKKLATVAGVIGGGYLGNEIGKRMQQD